MQRHPSPVVRGSRAPLLWQWARAVEANFRRTGFTRFGLTDFADQRFWQTEGEGYETHRMQRHQNRALPGHYGTDDSGNDQPSGCRPERRSVGRTEWIVQQFWSGPRRLRPADSQDFRTTFET